MTAPLHWAQDSDSSINPKCTLTTCFGSNLLVEDKMQLVPTCSPFNWILVLLHFAAFVNQKCANLLKQMLEEDLKVVRSWVLSMCDYMMSKMFYSGCKSREDIWFEWKPEQEKNFCRLFFHFWHRQPVQQVCRYQHLKNSSFPKQTRKKFPQHNPNPILALEWVGNPNYCVEYVFESCYPKK